MKKFIVFCVAFLFVTFCVSAQTSKEIKSAKKEAKALCKQLNAEGFKLLELGDMQTQLEKYMIKVYSGTKQIIGTCEGAISINLAKSTALNNALVDYASQQGGMIKGRAESIMSKIGAAQMDNFVAAYERLTLKEIKGEVQTAITLVRKVKNNYDVRLYCLVDVDAAHAAAMKAMEQAAEEADLALEYGSQISDWINEGFKVTK